MQTWTTSTVASASAPLTRHAHSATGSRRVRASHRAASAKAPHTST